VLYKVLILFLQMKNQRIYLVGMPASGKSTLGKALARTLGYQFTDLDELLVKQEGMSIADIFQQQGEEYFRLREHQVLQQTDWEKTVMATGGGTPCFHNNMHWIRQHGFSIFLDVPPEVLARRSMQQKGLRPLLGQLTGQDLVLELERKRVERLPFYQQANLTVTLADAPLTACLMAIRRELGLY
jgi:shikimate kinase